MKKIVTILLVTILVACSKTESNKTGNLEISGSVDGLKKGKLYIHKLNDTNLVISPLVTLGEIVRSLPSYSTSNRLLS